MLSKTKACLLFRLRRMMYRERGISQCEQSIMYCASLILQDGPFLSPFKTFTGSTSNSTSLSANNCILGSPCCSAKTYTAFSQQTSRSSREQARKAAQKCGSTFILRSPPQRVERRLNDSNSFFIVLSMKDSRSLASRPTRRPPYCRREPTPANRYLSDSLELITTKYTNSIKNASAHQYRLFNPFLAPSSVLSCPMIHNWIMSEQQGPCLFGVYFNLHPMDAFQHTEGLTNALQSFTQAFKDRIEAEIDYSKAMVKIGRKMEKYISPDEPTPLSYISSAFKVEHEQRARHALELAEYLHTEIEVPCQILLDSQREELRLVEKELKKAYRDGESVEDSYQKHLKKYYRARQEWEQHVIAKSVLQYTPGATQTQKEKAATRVAEERAQNQEHLLKYTQALQVFNSFAQRYNGSVGEWLRGLEGIQLRGLALQTDSIRKLIVSEVNMFKNIQYDLLNISRQMEAVSPQSQIECFVINGKDTFKAPIISIYAEGPVANRYEFIDFKCPLKRSLLEQTLLRIDRGLFTWILQNKNNSTLRYTVERLLKRYEEPQAGDNDFLEEFESCIGTNRTVRDMPIDGTESFLNIEEAYSLCIEVVAGIAQLMRAQQLYEAKIKSLYQLIQGCLATHHFYRFVAFLALDEYQSMHEQKVEGLLAGKHYLALIKLLVEQSIKAKDVFAARCTLPLLFTVASSVQGRQRYFFREQAIQQMDVWQDRDFWEAAVFEATFELITMLPTVERAQLKEVYLMRQKNVIFSGLVDYCHYMVMLGMEVADVRSVVGRLAQIYSLYEEHERDLSKTIANSYEQYKVTLAE